MKRSLLKSFDPLPHALSTKALSALVAIVVLGIGVTVARYLESSTGPAHRSGSRSVFSRSSEVRAAPSDCGTSESSASDASHDGSPRSSGESFTRRMSGCKIKSWSASSSGKPSAPAEASAAKPVDPTMPSLYQPEDKTSGS
jgi:hypothetical protein